MKIHSIEFVPNWSWGLVIQNLINKTDNEFDRSFFNIGHNIKKGGADIVFCQNVTLLKHFIERIKVVCRMGGNQNFDGKSLRQIEPLLKEMSKCYCIVATNKKLFDIASSIHKRVYLVPNGIDLNEWAYIEPKKRDVFTVGFCGNISNPIYKEYKGWDFVEKACKELGVELKTALYKNKQIPHNEMRDKFYGEIDCIVHPTKGEGSSNTLMEACACGVPVITTECAGYHGEMMQNGENVLFCERSVESIKECISKLMKSQKTREKLSKGARQFAVDHHDITVIAKEYDRIFKECKEYNDALPPQIEVISIFTNSTGRNLLYSVDGKVYNKRFPVGATKEQMIGQIQEELKKCK